MHFLTEKRRSPHPILSSLPGNISREASGNIFTWGNTRNPNHQRTLALRTLKTNSEKFRSEKTVANRRGGISKKSRKTHNRLHAHRPAIPKFSRQNQSANRGLRQAAQINLPEPAAKPGILIHDHGIHGCANPGLRPQTASGRTTGIHGAL